MTPELSAALGVDDLEGGEAQCSLPAQRNLVPAPEWATPPSPANASGVEDAHKPTASTTIAFVREEGLNLRAKADQKATSLLQMRFGQRVHVLEDSSGSDWIKVAVLGKTGYAYRPRIHFPPGELIAKDPGLSLVKVKSGQTFWGLVKDSYGIQGNESTKDQNINHFINAIRAVNKPEAFKIKTGILDDLGNAAVSGRDASDTELVEGIDLWIPSFGVAAKMDVGSGTLRGEATRYVKKFEQKLEDFGDACLASGKYIPEAIGRRSGEMAMGMLQGLLDFALDAAKILGASTAAGALIGAFFGGAGAAPGAALGFEIGMLILEYYGLAMLAEAVLVVSADLISQLGQFIALAWDANGDKVKIEKAGKALAEALGILVSALLVVAAAYLMKRGANALAKTKFAQRVGQTRLAKWFEERQKGTSTKEALEKERLAKEKAAKEKAAKEKAAKEKAAKEKAAKEKAEQEEAAKKAEEEKAAKEKAEQEEAAKKTEHEKLDADAKKAAKEVSGNVTKEETKPSKYDYGSETASVEAKVRSEAQAAAEQAYKDAVTNEGKAPAKAKEAAQKAAKEKAKEIAAAEAKRVAHERAQQELGFGGAFDKTKLDADAQSQLADYGANKTGGEAKRLSGELDGKSAQDFSTKMNEEVAAGKCTKKPVAIKGPPPQTMNVYEYPDGTVVRHKPLGDTKRPGETYSIEVKKDPSLPDLGKDDAAFKVDSKGTAVPKGPHETKNPYPSGSVQYEEFMKAIMNAGHHSLSTQ